MQSIHYSGIKGIRDQELAEWYFNVCISFSATRFNNYHSKLIFAFKDLATFCWIGTSILGEEQIPSQEVWQLQAC